MIKTPLISVIVPNYNHGSFLHKRLDSILNQTYKNFELIILDDASTDNSKDIIAKYKSRKQISHIIFNEHNSGSTFKQWDLGINKAKGDYIWIAESDDYCESVFLEDLISNLTEDEDTVLAYCQSIFVDENDRVLSNSSAEYIYQTLSGKDFIKKHLLYYNSVYNASMCIWKKSCYENMSKEFLNYKYCGDWIFWNELVTQGKVFISGKSHNFYRRHAETASYYSYKSGNSNKEELLAINYLSQIIKAYQDNLYEIIFIRIKQHYNNTQFIKTYQDIIYQHPKMKYPFLRRKIFYLKLKAMERKLKNILKGNPY
jgi:glycosyltransferase involved in cell wall biosynthesis